MKMFSLSMRQKIERGHNRSNADTAQATCVVFASNRFIHATRLSNPWCSSVWSPMLESAQCNRMHPHGTTSAYLR